MTALRYLSVCSGIEAATVAWEPLGWQPAAFAETDPFASAVLAHHYPAVPNLGDFTKIGPNDVGAVDLLIGGTPCQDFSVAGLRAGMAGDRGQLTIEFARLADRIRPRWLVWENVPGVLSADEGRAFGTFLGLLGELGYGFAFRVLDAQYFGVPQRRRRVFVVGHSRGEWRRAGAVLFERESLLRHPPPRRASRSGSAVGARDGARSGGGGRDGGLIAGDGAGDGVTQALTASFGSGGADAARAQAGWLVADSQTGETTDVAGTLDQGAQDGPRRKQSAPVIFAVDTFATISATAAGIAPNLVVTHALTAAGHDASEDGTGRGTPLVVDSAIAFSCKDYGGDAVEDVTPTLRSMNEVGGNQNGGGQLAIVEPALLHVNKGRPAGRASAHTDMVTIEEIVPTLTTDGHARSAVVTGEPLAFDPTQITSGKNRSNPQPGLSHPLAASAYPPHIAFGIRSDATREGIAQTPSADAEGSVRLRNPGLGVYEEPAPTLDASAPQIAATTSAVRRITPREAERLQGFPDDWTLIPDPRRGGKPAADQPRYHALGNSFAVPVVRWIGERIATVDAIR